MKVQRTPQPEHESMIPMPVAAVCCCPKPAGEWRAVNAGCKLHGLGSAIMLNIIERRKHGYE